MIKYFLFLSSLLSSCANCLAQYAPAAGKIGSTALNKDSAIFINWAAGCTIYRGWKNIAEKDSGFASIGDSASVIGKAGENGVLSLGDSGIALCRFTKPITNGPGFDFAVFENTFDDRYLELAFVEVSSDGRRFFRFSSSSLTDTGTQTGPFDYTEPENINNLAGKYRYGYGTPFDLDELPDYKDLNKNQILYVRIVDVVGSINSKYASLDTAFRKINDPWPTPFPSSGFDLDAIGIIHELNTTTILDLENPILVKGPNPLKSEDYLSIHFEKTFNSIVKIYDSRGQLIHEMESYKSEELIDGEFLPKGFFYIQISANTNHFIYKGFRL